MKKQNQGQQFSLKKFLTRAKYCNKKHYSKKCSKLIKEGSFHTFKKSGGIFDLKEDMIWESSDLVYVVIFSICNKESIGETG